MHLQSTAGFRAVVPHLFGRNPSGIAEVILAIDDPELYSIQLMPTRSPMDLRVRDQAIDALVASASAAVDLLSKLPGSPKITIYIWDEFDPTQRDPSEAVKEKLERFYWKSDDVLVLSQFLGEPDGGFSAQTIAVRSQWQKNLRDYRPFPKASPRRDIPFGWTAQAIGAMSQVMLSGAVSRLALRRAQDLEASSFRVPITAVIHGDGRVLTNEE